VTSRDDARAKLAEVLAHLADAAGADFGEEVMAATPERWLGFLEGFLTGYTQPLPAPARYQVEELGPVRIEGIRFHSLCEHHMLPFFGTVIIEYEPNGLVVGVSDLLRMVERQSARLQLQERLTAALADDILEVTVARRVAVKVTAEHLCVSMRGPKSPGALMTTEAVRPEAGG